MRVKSVIIRYNDITLHTWVVNEISGCLTELRNIMRFINGRIACIAHDPPTGKLDAMLKISLNRIAAAIDSRGSPSEMNFPRVQIPYHSPFFA